MTEREPHDAVVIERTFDAPVEAVWRMWTEPAHFKAWYGPDGASVPVAEMEVRVGGSRLVCVEVQRPGGPVRMWFTGEYREVVANQRLVYTDSLCDEHGNVLAPSTIGMPDGHPTTTVVHVEFAETNGRTRLVLTHAGVPSDSPGAGGWASALGKLAVAVRQAAARAR